MEATERQQIRGVLLIAIAALMMLLVAHGVIFASLFVAAYFIVPNATKIIAVTSEIIGVGRGGAAGAGR
jgi:hypothetical protein